MTLGKQRLRMKGKTVTFLVVTFILAACLAACGSCNSCSSVPLGEQGSTGEVASLDDPVEKPGKIDTDNILPTSSGEEVWRVRCGQCHDPEFGLDKFQGEDWEFIIGREIKRGDAHFTPELSQKVYRYLYNRTKEQDDPPFEEIIRGKSQFGEEHRHGESDQEEKADEGDETGEDEE